MEVLSDLALGPKAGPESMGPPATKTQGMSRRAAAISIPGTVLSQPASRTRPSRRWARAITSTLSATRSREGSE